MMVFIERVSFANADQYRRTRLAALQDTPLAFGSTYERENLFTEEQWEDRVQRSVNDLSCTYLAFDTQAADDYMACGLAGAFPEGDPVRATLVSMWVAPTHRRLGVGKLLVESCIAWCRLRGIQTIRLQVTDINHGAVQFYEGLGFRATGNREPYPNDPALVEIEMEMPLGPI